MLVGSLEGQYNENFIYNMSVQKFDWIAEIQAELLWTLFENHSTYSGPDNLYTRYQTRRCFQCHVVLGFSCVWEGTVQLYLLILKEATNVHHKPETECHRMTLKENDKSRWDTVRYQLMLYFSWRNRCGHQLDWSKQYVWYWRTKGGFLAILIMIWWNQQKMVSICLNH